MTPAPPTPLTVRLPRHWAVALGLAVVAGAVFAPTVGHDFVALDDGATVINNPPVRGGVDLDKKTWTGGLTPDGVVWAVLAVHAGYWHPVTWVSLQLDVTLFGPDPWGFHLTNVILHALDTAVLFLVLRRLTGRDGRSAAVALLWALHPLRVEPVSWVTSRKDMLSGLFFLLSIAAYVRYTTTESRRWYWLTFAAFALGMLTKPMLVTTPCLLLLLDAWPLARMRSAADLPRLIWEKAPFFVVSVLFTGITAFAAWDVGATHSFDALPFSERVVTALVGCAAYLRMTIWPSELVAPCLLGPRPAWMPVTGAALLVAFTAAAVLLRRRAPYLAVGWFWFVGMLVPVCGLFQSGTQEYADRFTYLPHVGLLLAVVWGAADLANRLRVPVAARFVAVALLAAACAAQCERLIPHWRSGKALWERVVETQPHHPQGWFVLSLMALEEENDAEAIRLAEESARRSPDSDSYGLLVGQIRERIWIREVKRSMRTGTPLPPGVEPPPLFTPQREPPPPGRP